MQIWKVDCKILTRNVFYIGGPNPPFYFALLVSMDLELVHKTNKYRKGASRQTTYLINMIN